MLRRARVLAGVAVGEVAALASRVARRGSGASVKGQILTRVAPNAFADLLAGRRIIAVTGTNGKTTTSHLVTEAVAEALGSGSGRLISNSDGANLRYGIASALASAPKADLAVLETDERVVPDLLRVGRPEVLVLLNFSRDQLDRNFEISILARDIRSALTELGEDAPVVVANSDDPLAVWAAQAAPDVVWVDTAATWESDAALCPSCGTLLDRRNPEGDASGSWDCPGCRLTEPKADYLVSGSRITLPDGSVVEPELDLPGKFNVANAACALAAVHQWGVDTDTALTGFRRVTAPAGRFATVTIGQASARLLLAKNPAGWMESLQLATGDTLVLAINAIAADGNDPSWLWDVEFEQLRDRHVIVTGPRAYDMAIRLSYAEVPHEVIQHMPDALDAAATLTGGEKVDVVTTYTTFQKLLAIAGAR